MATIGLCLQPVSYPYIVTKSSGFCSINNTSKHKKPVGGGGGGVKFCSLKAKASANGPSTKRNSVICADCDGNGAVPCSQCKGKGVNSVDHFNGQFKAGDSCWLCGGKKDMLCGNCNGAGFIGGFMTSSDA